MKKCSILLLCASLLALLVPSAAASAGDSITVRVGVYENSPKIFADEEGRASGFWGDIVKYIASEEGWRVEYVPGTWNECLTRLQSNEIDMMPDVAYTEDRAALYDFSKEAVYVSWSRVYARRGVHIESILDLEGKNVAVLRGSVNVEGPEGIKTLVSAFDVQCEFIETDSYNSVFELADAGEADAAVVSKDYGHLHAADYDVVETPIVFQPSSLHFALTKGSSLTPYLIERVDSRVEELKGDQGSLYYRSLESWLGIRPAGGSVARIPRWVIWTLVGVLLLVLLLAAGALFLSSQVKTRTRELKAEAIERQKYEEMDKLKGNLLSMVSHELRTPLATIKGYSTMLIDYNDRLDNDEKARSLMSIDKATDRLVSLVDQLLDMSRMEAGLLKLEKDLVDPAVLTEQTVADARLRAPEYRLEADVPAGLPLVRMDANRIRQVLENLIDNAVKYASNGRVVTVSALSRGTELVFSVADHGLGIPESELDKIFDRLYRIEERPGTQVQGLGLGLAICRGLVEAHGGRIWAESRIGQGSRFVFTIPLGA